MFEVGRFGVWHLRRDGGDFAVGPAGETPGGVAASAEQFAKQSQFQPDGAWWALPTLQEGRLCRTKPICGRVVDVVTIARKGGYGRKLDLGGPGKTKPISARRGMVGIAHPTRGAIARNEANFGRGPAERLKRAGTLAPLFCKTKPNLGRMGCLGKSRLRVRWVGTQSGARETKPIGPGGLGQRFSTLLRSSRQEPRNSSGDMSRRKTRPRVARIRALR
jgi:hypothetical protein